MRTKLNKKPIALHDQPALAQISGCWRRRHQLVQDWWGGCWHWPGRTTSEFQSNTGEVIQKSDQVTLLDRWAIIHFNRAQPPSYIHTWKQPLKRWLILNKVVKTTQAGWEYNFYTPMGKVKSQPKHRWVFILIKRSSVHEWRSAIPFFVNQKSENRRKKKSTLIYNEDQSSMQFINWCIHSIFHYFIIKKWFISFNCHHKFITLLCKVMVTECECATKTSLCDWKWM